jgi:hypothetical protein
MAPEPAAVAEVRRVRECHSLKHLPHWLDSRQSTASDRGPIRKPPAGLYLGARVTTSLGSFPGPECILVSVGFPVFDGPDGELRFLEGDIVIHRSPTRIRPRGH